MSSHRACRPAGVSGSDATVVGVAGEVVGVVLVVDTRAARLPLEHAARTDAPTTNATALYEPGEPHVTSVPTTGPLSPARVRSANGDVAGHQLGHPAGRTPVGAPLPTPPGAPRDCRNCEKFAPNADESEPSNCP